MHRHAGLPSRRLCSSHGRRLPRRWCDVRARGRCLRMPSAGRVRRSVIGAGCQIASSQRKALWLRPIRQPAALASGLAPICRSWSRIRLSYVCTVHQPCTVRVDGFIQRRWSKKSRADRTACRGAIFERPDLDRPELADADFLPRQRGAPRSQPQHGFARLSAHRLGCHPSRLDDTRGQLPNSWELQRLHPCPRFLQRRGRGAAWPAAAGGVSHASRRRLGLVERLPRW